MDPRSTGGLGQIVGNMWSGQVLPQVGPTLDLSSTRYVSFTHQFSVYQVNHESPFHGRGVVPSTPTNLGRGLLGDKVEIGKGSCRGGDRIEVGVTRRKSGNFLNVRGRRAEKVSDEVCELVRKESTWIKDE